MKDVSHDLYFTMKRLKVAHQLDQAHTSCVGQFSVGQLVGFFPGSQLRSPRSFYCPQMDSNSLSFLPHVIVLAHAYYSVNWPSI